MTDITTLLARVEALRDDATLAKQSGLPAMHIDPSDILDLMDALAEVVRERDEAREELKWCRDSHDGVEAHWRAAEEEIMQLRPALAAAGEAVTAPAPKSLCWVCLRIEVQDTGWCRKCGNYTGVPI